MENDDNYTNVILEEMRSQMTTVIELAGMTNDKVNEMSTTVDQLSVDVAELKSDMKVVKQAVTDTNKDVALLDQRVTKLEQA